jgi:C1A family cysteine protease
MTKSNSHSVDFATYLLAGVGVFASLWQGSAAADEIAPPNANDPVIMISNSEFRQMVADGELKELTPWVPLEQYLEHLLLNYKNHDIVRDYVRQHPDDPAFLRLLAATPKHVRPDVNGNYSFVIAANGSTQPIETLGQSVKFGQVANSLITANDPVHQLALYTGAYSQYTARYAQLCQSDVTLVPGGAPPPRNGDVAQGPCATLAPPTQLLTPAALQGAPIDQTYSAIAALVSYSQLLYESMHLPAGSGPVACNDELGAGHTAGSVDFGDETGDRALPSATGLLANFNFPSKNMLTCIKNQGHRGTCHIFAATSAIEELIARDIGVFVNLSEQDFMENSKFVWTSDYYNDGGYALEDLQNAASFGYKFAFEQQWDYNPSWPQPLSPAYEYIHSCDNYPSSEPGCSATAPQAREYCTQRSIVASAQALCGLRRVVLATASPYASAGASSFWNKDKQDLSVGLITLSLAFNNAVILAFNATDSFQSPSGGFIQYTAGGVDNSIGNHEVHIVGYVSNEDIANNPNTASQTPASGGGYFIIKNSWGMSYGDVGYSYMPVDYLKANAIGLTLVSSFKSN